MEATVQITTARYGAHFGSFKYRTDITVIHDWKNHTAEIKVICTEGHARRIEKRFRGCIKNGGIKNVKISTLGIVIIIDFTQLPEIPGLSSKAYDLAAYLQTFWVLHDILKSVIDRQNRELNYLLFRMIVTTSFPRFFHGCIEMPIARPFDTIKNILHQGPGVATERINELHDDEYLVLVSE